MLVEVAGTNYAEIIEEFLKKIIFTTIFTTK